ncbi:cytidylyltransferase domain-containing protein [Pontibacter pudoricolor]|uniref:cytidylyltransferase domain-containing protein n=1 Tax=Pontibacter pudoricolor TaxID=2694930 RepID=UPI0013908262|nr:glycosyltransferase family protein [Pontibacter pudoricolor]
MVRVGAIIQARLGSERLPNKAMLPLPFSGGPALLQHVLNRARAATIVNEVIVATTENEADDAIERFCNIQSILCFRGNEQDVLDRFIKAATNYNLDIIVRLTADNPFISPETINKAVQQHIQESADYTITEGLPLGTNIEVISYSALKQAANQATEQADREHVTPYIRREAGFKKLTLPFDSPLKPLRLTVDYPSDYALASLLYEKLYATDPLFGFDELIEILQQNPWLKEVNAGNKQRTAFADEADEMQQAKQLLQKAGFTRVLGKL